MANPVTARRKPRRRAPAGGRPPVTGTARNRPIQVRVAPDEHALVSAAVDAHNLANEHDQTTPSDWLRRHGVAAARALKLDA